MDVTIDGRDDEGNYSEEEGSISRADVEINVETKNKVTVGSIVGTAQAGTNDARHAMDTKLKRHSTKDAFVKFKEEAGANGLKRTEIG